MVQITGLLTAPARGSFFYDDQAAIRNGARPDGATYLGSPKTPGFSAVRIPADCSSVGLVLSDGAVVWGDCASVQYSGASGRDPLMSHANSSAYLADIIAPRLAGLDPANTLEICDRACAETDESRVPMAIAYGVSQALLRAAAHADKITMAEVVCREFDLPLPRRPVPLFSQSGDDRYDNVDKMILKSVDILPHGLINSREKFGEEGQALRDYALWVARRVRQLGGDAYRPILHFDTYGWLGLGLGLSPRIIAEYIARLADDLPDFILHIESPADYGSIDAQIDQFAEIVRLLAGMGSTARIVADEYCNTLDDVRRFCDAKAGHIVQIKTPDVGSLFDTVRAIRYARTAGIGAYCGGTSAETDLSARACVHVACATEATMMLAKPGMGVDEGIAIVGNEQARLLATIGSRQPRGYAA